MHVLLSAYACAPSSGSESYIGHNWVRQIARFHDVVVLTDARNRTAILRFPYGNRVRFEFVESLVSAVRTGSEFEDWRGREWWGYYRFLLKALARSRRLFREEAFDLTHLVTWANFRWPFLLALLPCPSVLGPVGGGERYPPAFRRGCVYETMRGWSIGLSRFDPILRLTLARTTLIIAATQATALALPLTCRSKVRRMSMGIDLAEANPRGVGGRSQGEFVILWVGLLIKLKALDLLLAALPLVRAGLGDSFRVVVCGDGPERPKLEAQAQALGVLDRVKFRGWVRREEVTRAHGEADVFCLTSLRETAPVALMEAMASRLPVVCLAHGGQGEIVTDECGVRVPVTNRTQVVVDLASALINLAKDPDLRQVLGDGARRRVEDVYDWDRVGDQVDLLYKEALACRR